MKIPIPGINLDIRIRRSKEVIKVEKDEYEICTPRSTVVFHILSLSKTTHLIHRIEDPIHGYYWDHTILKANGETKRNAIESRPPVATKSDSPTEEEDSPA